ncbi:pantoate--beta-alanine ligase [Paenibacillus aurantius]|uniref:Pantothenate synthetase n=1 Tax=Paenibacillus aurantius TaxID=2918900 RepID=A0AA96RDM4_9BACL|nr:pantoate--beta-alanine ligase [Paenibacillus aurantius]WNQ09253.1 pantoate--beta-alanine ligase [Paenibacillus aurantius]
MKVIRTIAELKQALRTKRREAWSLGTEGSVGFVPTMGFLHEGHASLLKRAREENEIAVLSIFVNPTQFGPNEDFERYPRNEEKDLSVAADAGVDFVFMPPVQEMYPGKSSTTVSVAGVTDRLCGASRPGHFDGVATVVSKLFHIVEPDRAYFGMKDAQQVAVIETMVRDLNLNVEIVPCPTVREPDGLALSSRNVYLSEEHRKEALVLSQALALSDRWLAAEGGRVEALTRRITDYIQSSPSADIDYVEVLSYPSLTEPKEGEHNELDKGLLIALAVRFGQTRLIDNRLIPYGEIQ